MSSANVIQVDPYQIKRHAARLTKAADEMRQARPELYHALANGASQRPVIKIIDDVKVTIGAAPYQHSGVSAGELIAKKIKACKDAYTATEEGLRAMGVVMQRMAAAISDGDQALGDDLATIVADLYCVVKVTNGKTDAPNNWFGLEQR